MDGWIHRQIEGGKEGGRGSLLGWAVSVGSVMMMIISLSASYLSVCLSYVCVCMCFIHVCVCLSCLLQHGMFSENDAISMMTAITTGMPEVAPFVRYTTIMISCGTLLLLPPPLLLLLLPLLRNCLCLSLKSDGVWHSDIVVDR